MSKELPSCVVCGRTIKEVDLHRSNPVGDPDPAWVCDDDMVEPIPEDRETMLNILSEKRNKE